MKFDYEKIKRNTLNIVDKAKFVGVETKKFSKTLLAHRILIISMVSCWLFGGVFSVTAFRLEDQKNSDKKYTFESDESVPSDSSISIDEVNLNDDSNIEVDSSSESDKDMGTDSEEAYESNNNDTEQPWWDNYQYDEYGNLIPPPKLDGKVIWA